MKTKVKIAIVLALWLPALIAVAGWAQGLDAADFSGFDMGAKAAAISFTFDSPSLGIPAKPTGEMNFAYSEASLQSGPSGYGLGSILWPGQVTAALPSFMHAEIERNCMCDLPVPTTPNYPVRAESFYPQGPTAATLDAGTMHMRSSAKPTSAEGIAYLNRFSVPAIGTMGNQSSFSTLGFDPEGAVAQSEAAATDVSLLDGLIKIDSVVSRLTARSDGEKGTVAGTTTVSGATVQGVGAVVIDAAGVHVADSDVDTAAQQQALNQILNQAGITMQLSEPVDTIAGPQARRSLGGVLISVKSSTIEPLIAALPQDLQTQIRGQITFDQVFSIQIAPAAVSAGAARTIEFAPPEVPAEPTQAGGDDTSVGGETEVPTGEGGTTTDLSGDDQPSVEVGGGAPIALAPVRSDFDGIPLWLTILLVLIALVSSRPLTMLADRIFAARAAAGCPNERG